MCKNYVTDPNICEAELTNSRALMKSLKEAKCANSINNSMVNIVNEESINNNDVTLPNSVITN
jgi:hypothetical protein